MNRQIVFAAHWYSQLDLISSSFEARATSRAFVTATMNPQKIPERYANYMLKFIVKEQ